MKRLQLHENKLTGPVPTLIGKLMNLETLFLHDNQLFGTVPQELGNLVNLTALILDMNYFTGSLPQNIYQGRLFQQFTASHNQFSGQIPKSLQNCSGLLRLQLKGNKLSRNMSEDFGAYPRLNFIDLGHNNFLVKSQATGQVGQS